MTLSRRTPLRRHARLAPGKGLPKRNEKRSREKRAQNFGDESVAVRAMPCLVAVKQGVAWYSEWGECLGEVQAAHVTARGSGGAKGGRFDLVPLCAHHHEQAGEANRPGETAETKRDAFERRYGLDLRPEADRIALEHAPPLGLRGLAWRWKWTEGHDGVGASVCEAIHSRHAVGESWESLSMDYERSVDEVQHAARLGERLDDYERAALLGWVRRRMAAYVAGAKSMEVGWDRESMAEWIALDLGEPFTSDPSGEHGLAWVLCEVAGWPEAGHD